MTNAFLSLTHSLSLSLSYTREHTHTHVHAKSNACLNHSYHQLNHYYWNRWNILVLPRKSGTNTEMSLKSLENADAAQINIYIICQQWHIISFVSISFASSIRWCWSFWFVHKQYCCFVRISIYLYCDLVDAVVLVLSKWINVIEQRWTNSIQTTQTLVLLLEKKNNKFRQKYKNEIKTIRNGSIMKSPSKILNINKCMMFNIFVGVSSLLCRLFWLQTYI